MRLLDPNLLTSETGKILVRDNAIVFSMEHVRCIITADCVIIPQTGFEQSSLSMRFAGMLEEAIIEASQEKEVCVQDYLLLPITTCYYLSLPVTTCYCLHCKSPAKPHTGHYSWQQNLLSMPACSEKGLTAADRSCLHDGTSPLLYQSIAPSPDRQSHLHPLLQARLTYEMAMANRDASSVDEHLAKDYDDRLSDDSSGEPNLDPPCIPMFQQRRFLQEHLTLGQGRQGTDAIQLWTTYPLADDICLAYPLMQGVGVENVPLSWQAPQRGTGCDLMRSLFKQHKCGLDRATQAAPGVRWIEGKGRACVACRLQA